MDQNQKKRQAWVADTKGNLNIFVAACEKDRKKVKRKTMTPNEFADRWLGTDAVRVIMHRQSLRTGQRFV
jgi:nitrous oxidase accessory protein NosD